MTTPRIVAVEEHIATDEFLQATAELEVWPGDAMEMRMMRGAFASPDQLTDIGTRVEVMNASGVDTAVLSLNPPGVQPYTDTAAARSLAETANDALAEIIACQPGRFAGLGAVAPQDPAHAASEIERIMGPLALQGIMICSHTHGRYLDDPRCEPILAAAEAHGAPIYLHPRMPAPGMIAPYRDYGLAGAVWGYQADAGVHALRLILSGTLDRFPDLKLVLGHLGEGLPLWLQRLDNRYAYAYQAGGKSLGLVKLELTPSEYVHRNFLVTTSGMSDHAAFAFCLERLTENAVMFAIDSPYEDATQATQFLRTAELTETQRAKVSQFNAEKLFNLPPR